jgi:hypothetical protein
MASGTLSKMKVQLLDNGSAEYFMRLGDLEIPMEQYYGKKIRMEFSGDIFCCHCGDRTNKSFSQGYCFKHARSLAACDLCIMRPETCHHHLGTCREPEWGEKHCMIPHTVYLANSTGFKVGITRSHQRMTRWLDQGAAQAIPLCTVKTRIDAGKVEVAIKKFISDKTNWRALLKGPADKVDLIAKRDELLKEIPNDVEVIVDPAAEETNISYSVSEFPEKIKSHNFDKDPVVEGFLWGIKGQYLIMDTGVINIRKFTSYDVTINEYDTSATKASAPSEPAPEQKTSSFILNIDEIPRTGPYGNW